MQVKTFIKGKVCVHLYNCYFFLLLLKNREKKKVPYSPSDFEVKSMYYWLKVPYDLRNELKEPIYI